MLANVFGPGAVAFLLLLLLVAVAAAFVIRRLWRHNGRRAPDKKGKPWSPPRPEGPSERP